MEITEVLRKAQLYDLAQEVANDGIYDCDLINGRVHFDAIGYKIAGYENLEFPGDLDEWRKRVHPDDIHEALEKLTKYLEGKINVYDIEFRFMKKDSSWMWIRDRIKKICRDELGRATRLVGTHTDVTDKKMLELKLEQEDLEAHPDDVLAVKYRPERELAEQSVLVEDLKNQIDSKNELLSQCQEHYKNESQKSENIFKNSISTMLLPLIENIKIKYPAEKDELSLISASVVRILNLSDLDEKIFKSLTPREMQIYSLVIEKKTSKDIAKGLFLSLSTVERHRHNIRKKIKEISN